MTIYNIALGNLQCIEKVYNVNKISKNFTSVQSLIKYTQTIKWIIEHACILMP